MRLHLSRLRHTQVERGVPGSGRLGEEGGDASMHRGGPSGSLRPADQALLAGLRGGGDAEQICGGEGEG
eukprot:6947289-Pyramimonas_sp.AAC.1